MTPKAPLNFRLIGHNVRSSRMAQNCTQAELAHLASVNPSTVKRIESGRPIHLSNLERICEAMGRQVEVVASLMPYGLPDDPSLVHLHRSAELSWFATGDRRKNVPKQNRTFLQSQEERSRLARLGLVDMFEAYLVTMPYGPSISYAEVAGVARISPNVLYHTGIIHALRGDVLVNSSARRILLSAGDSIGFGTDALTTVEPACPLGADGIPPLVLLVLGNRRGHSPREFKNSQRKRIRK